MVMAAELAVRGAGQIEPLAVLQALVWAWRIQTDMISRPRNGERYCR